MPSIRTRYAVFGISVIAALLLAAGGLSEARPRTCQTCHKQIVEATAASSHNNVDCYACHAGSGIFGTMSQKSHEVSSMYPRAAIGMGVTRPARQTTRGACLACHGEVLRRIVTGKRIRIDHAQCANGPTCDTCHSTVAHGTSVRWQSTPAMEDCIRCHTASHASTACKTCHLTDATGAATRTSGPWQVTHGSNWKKTHGMGDVKSCGTCHPKNYCVRCHGMELPHPSTFGATHSEEALKNPEACRVCHPKDELCKGCHGFTMPHPSNFLQTHVKVANGTSDERCMRCHIDGDCQTCHEFHSHPGGAKGVPVPWGFTNENLRPKGGN